MVILRHAREILHGDFFGDGLAGLFNFGWIGVDLFFVLSGFLISSQAFAELRQEGRISAPRFYIKRALRILPSYYFVLLIYFLIPGIREHSNIDSAWKFLLFTINYHRQGEAFSHAWSLCIEEHFYFVFPLIVPLVYRRSVFIKPFVLIPLLLLGLVGLRYYLYLTNAPFYPAVYRPSHTHFDGLLIGVAIASIRNLELRHGLP